MMDRRDIVRECWGEAAPDWIIALVTACSERGASQNSVAQRLGYTGAVISQVLRNRYPGNLRRLEDRVRSVFLAGEITCPALGVIGSEDCLSWRDKSTDLTSVSPMTVRMFRACATCPRNQNDTQQTEEVA